VKARVRSVKRHRLDYRSRTRKRKRLRPKVGEGGEVRGERKRKAQQTELDSSERLVRARGEGVASMALSIRHSTRMNRRH